ncbi:MAG TPA: TetR/AcrR family transcriptional regulator [Micropepsaceae bacterium]|jgi:AcrR family transcriptional regulator|nr:TetR/AcrR family transcriptional regulator [Micropepsaceae bacterium]
MAGLKEATGSAQKPEIAPRERILRAARELFYGRGIKAVSVDEIAAAAQTNKMTLYRHFTSKDLLVAEYLRSLSHKYDAVWDEVARLYPGDPLAQLRALLCRFGEYLACTGNRGCAFANAAVEIPERDHPARAVIEEHKIHQRAQLTKLCSEAGFVDPERLADEIFLILEGARINIQSVGQCGPGARLTEMVSTIMTRHPRAGD